MGPILAKEFPHKYDRYNNKTFGRENVFDDASVPKSLIDIVQHRGESFYHQKLVKSAGLNRGRLKKGYLYRPKSFKPTYTYIQIWESQIISIINQFSFIILLNIDFEMQVNKFLYCTNKYKIKIDWKFILFLKIINHVNPRKTKRYWNLHSSRILQGTPILWSKT